jgi:thiol-disulfide isomerase/thioredoxin
MDRANDRRKAPALPRAALLLGALAFSAGVIAALLLFTGGEEMVRAPAVQSVSKNLVRLRAPDRVPDLTFADGEGKTRRLSEWRGGIILLNLWATWCAPCKAEMPSLDRLEAKLGGDGFTVIALSVDRGGAKKPAAFFAREGISRLKLYNDATGEASRRLGAAGLPLTLILNAKGEAVARFAGPADWDSPEMIAQLEALRKSPE